MLTKRSISTYVFYTGRFKLKIGPIAGLHHYVKVSQQMTKWRSRSLIYLNNGELPILMPQDLRFSFDWFSLTASIKIFEIHRTDQSYWFKIQNELHRTNRPTDFAQKLNKLLAVYKCYVDLPVFLNYKTNLLVKTCS